MAHCPRCAARLRPDQRLGAVCDPCIKAGHAALLPPEFFATDAVRAALAADRFGVFFRHVREYKGWTQTALGEVLDFLPQTTISQIERGRATVTDIKIVRKIHRRLGVPAALLGFGDDPDTVCHRTTTGESWMQRRDFVAAVAALALTSAAALDIDRLVALLYPDVDDTGPARVGASDVAALEHANREYERSHATYGGGIAREAAGAQLRTVLPLLTVTMTDAVRTRLVIATTHLALLTGWMEFDCEHHDAARRFWTVGLEVARTLDHPLSTDLTAHICFDMAQQALYLNRPDEAQRFVTLGSAAGVGSHRLTPSTGTALAVNAAFAHAARGRVEDTQRSLGEAQEAFTRIDPDQATPWACVDGPVKITTWEGHAYYELARDSGDPRLVSRAVELLGQVVDNPRPVSRALYLPDLAGAHALAGDLDTAVALGHQALTTTTAMASRRNYDRLRVLKQVLEPRYNRADVAELRNQLAVATAA